MAELKAGFSLSDIDRLDDELDISKRFTLRKMILDTENQKRRREIINIISIVDGVYLATASVQSKKNFHMFKSWRDKLMKSISRGQQDNIWDRISGKARKIR